MYQLHTLSLSDPAFDWDAFVDQDAEGTFFHLAGWRHILAASGHQCHYLYATKQESIVGILPLARVKSWLFGDALISTPFCVYGGALGNSDVKRFLEQAAYTLAKQLAVDYLELRYRNAQENQLQTRIQHAYFSCELADSAENILAGIKKKQRAVLRHAMNGTLQFRFDQDLNGFYQTYSQSVLNLGTPVFSQDFFRQIKTVFAERVEVLSVIKDNKTVSSVLSFYYKNEVLPYYGGGTRDAKELKSNDFMYYQLMCHARLTRGCQRYDFGRSKIDSGAYHYKRHWGMEPVELPYQYVLIKATALPNLSPNNPKYQLFIALWKKLPLALSQWLGPKLSRYLG
jgi:FemAB-related protein (PEP-CTERM system-associated)